MDWSDFADRLAAELVRLPDRAFLIVQGPTGLPYTQVLRADSALHAEAVGDAFLPVPLTSRQERKLEGLGWTEPDDDERLNWWILLEAPESTRPRPCGELAKQMTRALRDGYGVRSPDELIYQAGMTGPEGGTPLALPALGIPSAVPEAESAPSAGAPAGEVETERALTAARERGDQDGYLDLLARTTLYLPTPGADGEGGRHYATARFGGGTFVLAFTSPGAMNRSLRGQAVHHQTSTVGELVRDWPHPDWRLAVNPGLPSASYLDTHMLPKASAAGGPPAASGGPGTPLGGPASAAGVPAKSGAGAAPKAGGPVPPAPGDRHVAGLSMAPPPDPQATRLERVPAPESRPEPSPAGVMQKVLRPEHVPHYLEGGYDLVAGYVHKFEDMADLTRPEGLVRALGLDRPDSPFTLDMDAVHVLRWPAVKRELFRRSSDGGSGGSVSEFKTDSQRLPHGAEMYRLARQGRPTLVAVYDADLRRWRIRLATARGADKPRTPRTARRAEAARTRKERLPTPPGGSAPPEGRAPGGLMPPPGPGPAEAPRRAAASGSGVASGSVPGPSETRVDPRPTEIWPPDAGPSVTRPDTPRGRHARGGGWE